ncbi:MAG: SPOR domain-containing protein [Deltaproteobacteria bacterium]|nr:SPOR domain-containing protein [Deltaproteobacteria bacterium]
MTNPIPTRTKKRMERKHALWMMGLVLGVSLASFFFGITVGKQGSPPSRPGPEGKTITRIPVLPEKAVPPIASEPPAAKEVPETKLTFYETLPRTQGQPLGTGLNPPPTAPAQQPVKVAPASEPVSAPKRAAPDVAPLVPSVAAAPAPKPAAERRSVGGPNEVAIQVASFRNREDAENLMRNLLKKGFPGFVMEADLQDKGVWYRVMVGPYGDRNSAAPVVNRLKLEERLGAFIKQL